MLYQPQLPRPTAVTKGSKWEDIWNGIATLSKQNQNLVQYLQNYLTQVFKWLVPPKFNVSLVGPPYSVNATDAFIAASSAGAVTLPASSGSGRVIIVKNLGTGTIAVTPNPPDTVDGQTVLNITIQYDVLRLIDAQSGQWSTW